MNKWHMYNGTYLTFKVRQGHWNWFLLKSCMRFYISSNSNRRGKCHRLWDIAIWTCKISKFTSFCPHWSHSVHRHAVTPLTVSWFHQTSSWATRWMVKAALSQVHLPWYVTSLRRMDRVSHSYAQLHYAACKNITKKMDLSCHIASVNDRILANNLRLQKNAEHV